MNIKIRSANHENEATWFCRIFQCGKHHQQQNKIQLLLDRANQKRIQREKLLFLITSLDFTEVVSSVFISDRIQENQQTKSHHPCQCMIQGCFQRGLLLCEKPPTVPRSTQMENQVKMDTQLLFSWRLFPEQTCLRSIHERSMFLNQQAIEILHA